MGQAVSVSPAKCQNMFEYRRRLPHFHPHAAFVFVTGPLWGSPPPRQPAESYPLQGHAFVAADRVLDRSASGPKWLEEAATIADLIAGTIQIGEHERHFL